MDKSIYLDEQGYPGTRQADGSWDGGDTAAILGTVRSLAPDASSILFPQPYPWSEEQDKPIRHPSQPVHSNPDNFSRDQLIPELCSYIGLNYPSLASFRLRKAHAKRGYVTSWNGDLCGPEVWALWLRIFKPWWAKLVLPLLDVETLVNSVIWRLWRKDRVTRNHMLVCLMIQDHSPTWVGRLAYKLLDWPDMLQRWEDHCKAVGEYPTYDLFRAAYAEQEEKWLR